MRTKDRVEIKVADGVPVLHRVVSKISYIEGRAYGEITVNGMLRVVKQSTNGGTLHWSKDTWQLSDVYQGEV